MPKVLSIAGKRFQFNDDGSVTILAASAADPVKPSPVEQVKQKAVEMVQAVEEVVKPKRRGRRPKAENADL